MRPSSAHYEIFCRETARLDAEWRLSLIQFEDGTTPAGRGVRIVGAVFPAIEKGNRKGKPNFRKPVVGTKRSFFVSEAECLAWWLDQERSTGQCAECLGKGSVFARWSAASGTETRSCHRCGGSGNRVDP